MDGNGKSKDSRIIRNHFLSAENIVSLFQKYSVPIDRPFDLLSVDIDRNDFYVADTLLRTGYRSLFGN